MFHKHGLLVMAESHLPTDFCLRYSLIIVLAPPNYLFWAMAPSILQVYKYTGYTFIVQNLMYISHLSGVKHVKDTAVRICESLISDAVASPEVSPSGCRIKLL